MKVVPLVLGLAILSLSPALADGSASTISYVCDGGKRLQVGYVPRTGVANRARVTWAGQTSTLPPTRSADGARYSNGRWTWWSKGESGFLQVSGQTVTDNCTPR